MNSIITILRQHKENLLAKYPIRTLALFGSYSRGEETKNSDIDIMVELKVPDVRAFINLSYELESVIKKKVDLVSRNGVKERYMREIEKDLIYV